MGKKTEPKSKFTRHQKTVVLRMEFGKDFLREPQAAVLAGEFARVRIDEFKVREGLDGNANYSGDKATD